MTWYFHKLTTSSMVYAVSGDATASFVASAASILPDYLEMPFMGLIPHRTITHWPYLYVVMILSLGWLFYLTGHVGYYFGLFISIGCFLHLAEDALSRSGIPFGSPFGKTKGCDFYVVHTGREALTAFAIIVPCLCAAYLMGQAERSYLIEELYRASSIFSDLSHVLLGLIA